MNILSNEKFITNSPRTEEKIKDDIKKAKFLLAKFYSKDIVDDIQENCVDLEEYGLDIYNNIYSVGVNSKTIDWLGYYALFFDNNNKKIRLINGLNIYGFYINSRFKKDNKSKVFDFYQFYLDLESAVTISDLWKIKEYREFFGLYFKTFSHTKSLLDKHKRDSLIAEFVSSKQLSDLICNQIYKNFNN